MPIRFFGPLWILLATACGCTGFHPSTSGKSPLKPISLAEQGSELEIVFVRQPFNRPQINQDLWSVVDETQFSTVRRREMEQNGLRAGRISGEWPAGLAEMGESDDGIRSASLSPTETAARLEAVPQVQKRSLHVYPGQRSEILASPVLPEMNLLTRDKKGLRGISYFQAQGIFSLTARPKDNASVRVSLTPEVLHGDSRQDWIGEDGVIRRQSTRPKATFNPLVLDIELAKGETLVVGCRPDRPSSLGYNFFTEYVDGQLQQKLLLVRLQDSRCPDLFPLEPAPRTPQHPLRETGKETSNK